jgi:hypothetical protein
VAGETFRGSDAGASIVWVVARMTELLLEFISHFFHVNVYRHYVFGQFGH